MLADRPRTKAFAMYLELGEHRCMRVASDLCDLQFEWIHRAIRNEDPPKHLLNSSPRSVRETTVTTTVTGKARPKDSGIHGNLEGCAIVRRCTRLGRRCCLQDERTLLSAGLRETLSMPMSGTSAMFQLR